MKIAPKGIAIQKGKEAIHEKIYFIEYEIEVRVPEKIDVDFFNRELNSVLRNSLTNRGTKTTEVIKSAVISAAGRIKTMIKAPAVTFTSGS